MIERKKKLKIFQITLFILAVIIIYTTYSDKDRSSNKKQLISESDKLEISIESDQKGNVFKNIEYAGIDLSGNRYVLKSKKAKTNALNEELIDMEDVEAVFYFKDNTILYVWSEFGLYNNKTLDMKFNKNVIANYEQSELFAEKAEYSNSKRFLQISENVRIKDKKGNLFADKLNFNLENETLNIAAFNEESINANIILNEKRFYNFKI